MYQKLTPDDVRVIPTLLAIGGWGIQKFVAKEFGVSRETVRKVAQGKYKIAEQLPEITL